MLYPHRERCFVLFINDLCFALSIIGRAIFTPIRPDETAKKHTPLHPGVTWHVVNTRTFAINFVRAPPGTHTTFSLSEDSQE
jgi:hypothetical protein